MFKDKIAEVEKGCEKSLGCGNKVNGILCLCRMCKVRLETLKQYQTIAEEREKKILDIINSKLNILKDSTIDHIYSFFDRRINITEIQERIKEDFDNFNKQLNPAQTKDERI